jgi:hypothetical protein
VHGEEHPVDLERVLPGIRSLLPPPCRGQQVHPPAHSRVPVQVLPVHEELGGWPDEDGGQAPDLLCFTLGFFDSTPKCSAVAQLGKINRGTLKLEDVLLFLLQEFTLHFYFLTSLLLLSSYIWIISLSALEGEVKLLDWVKKSVPLEIVRRHGTEIERN